MSERKYTLPGMSDWIFQIDKQQNTTLLHKAGIGFHIAGMTAEAITERIEKILRTNLNVGDEATIDAIVQAARNIDWQKTIAKPLPELVAVLVNESLVNQARVEAIPAEVFDKIYKSMETAYLAIKAHDPRAAT